MHKPFTIRQCLRLVVAVSCLAACGLLLSGCGARRSSGGPPSPTLDPLTIDQGWAKAGVQSVADAQQLRALGDKAQRDGALDDADVDWAIAAMGHPSTAPYHAHMNSMTLFLSLRTITPRQQQRIRAAVAPLLTSNDPTDRRHVERYCVGLVLKKLDRLDQGIDPMLARRAPVGPSG